MPITIEDVIKLLGSRSEINRQFLSVTDDTVRYCETVFYVQKGAILYNGNVIPGDLPTLQKMVMFLTGAFGGFTGHIWRYQAKVKSMRGFTLNMPGIHVLLSNSITYTIECINNKAIITINGLKSIFTLERYGNFLSAAINQHILKYVVKFTDFCTVLEKWHALPNESVVQEQEFLLPPPLASPSAESPPAVPPPMMDIKPLGEITSLCKICKQSAQYKSPCGHELFCKDCAKTKFIRGLLQCSLTTCKADIAGLRKIEE